MAKRCFEASIDKHEAFPSHHAVGATFRFGCLPPRVVRDVPAALPVISLDKKTRESLSVPDGLSNLDQLISGAADADDLTVAFHSWSHTWEDWYITQAEKQDFVVKPTQRGRGCCTTKRLHGQKRAQLDGDGLPKNLASLRSLVAKLTHLAFCSKH
eukprot:1170593-Amphidinium_carterae.1